MITREEMIDELVAGDVAVCIDDPNAVGDMVRFGVVGYNSWSNEELAETYDTQVSDEGFDLDEWLAYQEEYGKTIDNYFKKDNK